ncbi:hypothetical protein PDL16_28845, partial [Bacillus cereus group sp. BY9-3LC]
TNAAQLRRTLLKPASCRGGGLFFWVLGAKRNGLKPAQNSAKSHHNPAQIPLVIPRGLQEVGWRISGR